MQSMTICKQVRELILNYMDSHGHHEVHAMEASVHFGCSSRTVWRLIRHRKHGESIGEKFLAMFCSKHKITSDNFILNTSDPKYRGQGKKHWIGIPTQALDALLSKLKVNPTLYAHEMADFLQTSEFGTFTVSQIWQGLRSKNITRKVLEVHAKEQNEIKRQYFLQVTSIYTAEQRFYVNER